MKASLDEANWQSRLRRQQRRIHCYRQEDGTMRRGMSPLQPERKRERHGRHLQSDCRTLLGQIWGRNCDSLSIHVHW